MAATSLRGGWRNWSNPNAQRIQSSNKLRGLGLNNGILQRIAEIFGRRAYWHPLARGFVFLSIASTAKSFRSTCDSERGEPDCSRHRLRGAAPHVGHRTENNCFVVSSLFFIYLKCGKGNALLFQNVGGLLFRFMHCYVARLLTD
jgi:hypothetical protein